LPHGIAVKDKPVEQAFASAKHWRCASRMWIGSTGNSAFNVASFDRRVDDVKTETSYKAITITQTIIEALKLWKQTTQFSAQEDWIFASPAQIGRLPWSADSVNDAYKKAASAAGIAHVSTHSMRHTYRSWLDAVGTPIAVQQKLMRHSEIRTTMNVYGDVVTDEMARAASKVAGLAVNGM